MTEVLAGTLLTEPLPTFVAVQSGCRIGSIQLAVDDVPVAKTFPDAVDAFRACGRRIASFTQLKMDAAASAHKALVAMFREAARYAADLDVTDLLVEVHPRHARLYARLYGMRQLGVERVCAAVGKPAVLMHAATADLCKQVAA